MAQGGHSRSGPPPDPNALRRARKSDKVTYTTLPERREGPPPPWPLSRPSARERAVWAREWARPQAHMWELLGLEVEAAVYVRTLVRAEQPDSAVTLLSTLSRQQDSLGLTVPGMARNRWVISTDDARSTAEPTEAAAEATGSSARDRLRLLGAG